MLQEVRDIAKRAGEKIMQIYETDFEVKYKDDKSPLTEADLAANAIIMEGLKEISEFPILSEEGKDVPYDVRKNWEKYWLVDPLDGTKDFLKKNGEFTVNIALIEGNTPILGVVYAPAINKMYYADENGSFCVDGESRTKLSSRGNLWLGHDHVLRIAVTRSHMNKETEDFLDSLQEPYEKVQLGSSLKICMVASGEIDLYPRLGPCMEWDTGAAHAIVKYAGKRICIHETDQELVYNKENLLNPNFIVK